MFRYLLLISLFVNLAYGGSAQNQEADRFVGLINGVSKDTFDKKMEINEFPDLHLPKLSQSPYNIEIRLYETDLPMGWSFCTIIYLDTVLKRKGVRNKRMVDDSTSQPESVSFSDSFKLDSIFSILIKNGIFSLDDTDPSLLDNGISANYNPYIMNAKGSLEKAGSMSVMDGVYYLLEFKVGNLFNSYSSFINPESFYRVYQDNQILRRQAEICSAMTCGRLYQ